MQKTFADEQYRKACEKKFGGKRVFGGLAEDASVKRIEAGNLGMVAEHTPGPPGAFVTDKMNTQHWVADREMETLLQD